MRRPNRVVRWSIERPLDGRNGIHTEPLSKLPNGAGLTPNAPEPSTHGGVRRIVTSRSQLKPVGAKPTQTARRKHRPAGALITQKLSHASALGLPYSAPYSAAR